MKHNCRSPGTDSLVDKSTFWVDSTWHKFFKSTRALLHESYPDKVIPGLGKIRKTFMLYCTRYIKKAKGMDYHNCPVCLPVKVNFPRIMKLLSKAHREHCTNSRCILAQNPSLLSNTCCFYFVCGLQPFRRQMEHFLTDMSNRVEHQKRNQPAIEKWPFGFVFGVQLGLRQTRALIQSKKKNL